MIKLYLDEDVPEAVAMSLRKLFANLNYEKFKNNIIWLSDWVV